MGTAGCTLACRKARRWKEHTTTRKRKIQTKCPADGARPLDLDKCPQEKCRLSFAQVTGALRLQLVPGHLLRLAFQVEMPEGRFPVRAGFVSRLARTSGFVFSMLLPRRPGARLALGLPCQPFELLLAARIAEHRLMPGSRKERWELATPQPRIQNANSHAALPRPRRTHGWCSKIMHWSRAA